jgi:hypothetical protein
MTEVLRLCASDGQASGGEARRECCRAQRGAAICSRSLQCGPLGVVGCRPGPGPRHSVCEGCDDGRRSALPLSRLLLPRAPRHRDSRAAFTGARCTVAGCRCPQAFDRLTTMPLQCAAARAAGARRHDVRMEHVPAGVDPHLAHNCPQGATPAPACCSPAAPLLPASRRPLDAWFACSSPAHPPECVCAVAASLIILTWAAVLHAWLMPAFLATTAPLSRSHPAGGGELGVPRHAQPREGGAGDRGAQRAGCDERCSEVMRGCLEHVRAPARQPSSLFQDTCRLAFVCCVGRVSWT